MIFYRTIVLFFEVISLFILLADPNTRILSLLYMEEIVNENSSTFRFRNRSTNKLLTKEDELTRSLNYLFFWISRDEDNFLI